MTEPECIICLNDGADESDSPLLRLPCGKHSICSATESGCLAGFFRQALAEERLYPTRCCDVELPLHEYEDKLPFDLIWEYMLKAREYSVPARLRVYCANKSCNLFLHVNDFEEYGGLKLVKCNACLKVTCVQCKTELMDTSYLEKCGAQRDTGSKELCKNEKDKRCKACQAILRGVGNTHTCELPEAERKFKETVQKKGYQECNGCGGTIELMEACNHITCECGNEFCYICGGTWGKGGCPKGCPRYGKPRYDAEGYNREGFHKDTGRDRHGRTPQEIWELEDEEEEEDDDIEEFGEGERQFLAELDADARAAILSLEDPEERFMALAQARFHAAERGELELREHQDGPNEDDNEGDEEAQANEDDQGNDGDSDEDEEDWEDDPDDEHGHHEDNQGHESEGEDENDDTDEDDGGDGDDDGDQDDSSVTTGPVDSNSRAVFNNTFHEQARAVAGVAMQVALRGRQLMGTEAEDDIEMGDADVVD